MKKTLEFFKSIQNVIHIYSILSKYQIFNIFVHFIFLKEKIWPFVPVHNCQDKYGNNPINSEYPEI